MKKAESFRDVMETVRTYIHEMEDAFNQSLGALDETIEEINRKGEKGAQELATVKNRMYTLRLLYAGAVMVERAATQCHDKDLALHIKSAHAGVMSAASKTRASFGNLPPEEE